MECMFSDNKKCRVLTKMQCDGCGFHLTTEQRTEKQKKSYARLNSLPVYTQRQIADTYYAGQMPWRE